jgi:hypothetical protein
MIKCHFKTALLSFLAFFFITKTFAQRNIYPQDYFRSPLDIPIYAAGTFGEIRSNHFHSGLDIKTDGVEGKNVYAVADGYVSRIKIAPNGFGNALYITHINGYVSVYGHLQKLNTALANYTKTAQYAAESFDVDLYLKPNQFPVKKGDVVALSGNTGSSGGPHLHFELRDAKTEETINPLLFGYKLIDRIPPTIKSFVVYPINKSSTVNGSNNKLIIPVVKLSSGEYTLKNNSKIKLKGNIGFGIETYDTQDNSSNENGIFSLQMLINGEGIYTHVIDRFSFDETKYVNSHIDYDEKMRNGDVVQKSYIQPNNKMRIYKNLINRGIYNFKDNKPYKIYYQVNDASKNTSILVINAELDNTETTKSEGEIYTALFPYNKENSYKTNEMELSVPLNALYDTVRFEYSTSRQLKNTYSNIHYIHNKYTALNKAITIKIKSIGLPEHLESKALIVAINDNNIQGVGGQYEEGWVKVSTKNFGTYAVGIDTIPPTIKSLNLVNGKNMQNFGTIKFIVSDDLSGIKSYRGSIDGIWILMELDSKSNTLSYTFDEKIKIGSHKFVLTVSDEKNNVKKFKADFIR